MILTILRVQYLRLRNNPLELLLVFVMPVVFFSIFAGIFSAGIATGGDKALRIAWISPRETPIGVQLLEFLEQHSSLQCTRLKVPKDTSQHQATSRRVPDAASIDSTVQEAQRSGKYDLIVRIPTTFPEQFSAVSTKADVTAFQVVLVSDGQNAMAVSMVSSIVKAFFAQKKAAIAVEQLSSLLPPGPSGRRIEPAASSAGFQSKAADPIRTTETFPPAKQPAEVFRETEPDWAVIKTDDVISLNTEKETNARSTVGPPQARIASANGETTRATSASPAQPLDSQNANLVNLIVETPQADRHENPRIAMYAAGIAVLFLLFSATGHAASLLEEVESGTLDRILVGQAGLYQIIGGKWLGIFLMGCLQITVMFLWAEIVFHIQLGSHLLGFSIMTASTAAATASFAMCMATICKSRSQLNAVSVVLILSMSAVGGSMIPRFVMSDQMKKLGMWTFNAWALDGFQKVFWFHSPISHLCDEVTVLLCSAVVLGLVTLLLSERWKRG